jgi:hypothetical protein
MARRALASPPRSFGQKVASGLHTLERGVNTALGLKTLYDAGRALYTAARPAAAAAAMFL